jgi:membrane protein
VVSAGLSAFSDYLSARMAFLGELVAILDFLISFAGITVLIALIFKYLPDATASWRDIFLGAAVTSLLFSVGKLAIGFYLGQTATDSPFGAANALVIVMLWAFYSSQIVFFGAEFTKIYATRFGQEIHPGTNAVRFVIKDQPERQHAAGLHAHTHS